VGEWVKGRVGEWGKGRRPGPRSLPFFHSSILPFRRFPILPLLLVAAVAGTTSGCTRGLVRRGVERRLQRRLTDILGPAQQYRVRIHDTRDPELVLGRARRVEIEGRKILARGQFDLEWLKLVLIDLRYEGGEPYLVSVRRSDLEVEVTDQALTAYLKQNLPRYEPELHFEPDRVHVRMTYRFLGSPTPIEASGQLLIQEGRRLLFSPDEARVPFILDPESARRFVSDRINPLLDFSRFDFPARLESVQVLQGRLKAHGTAALESESRN
jgi:hypothetical protein